MNNVLDGKYLISTTSSYNGPLNKKSDGQTEIINGQTHRVDENGCKWTSIFRLLNDSEVELTSTADPTNAPIDFALTKQDGTPTRNVVTYTSILRLQRKDERIQMSGQISYGKDVVLLTMRKIL
jgi:hypothetical protein